MSTVFSLSSVVFRTELLVLLHFTLEDCLKVRCVANDVRCQDEKEVTLLNLINLASEETPDKWDIPKERHFAVATLGAVSHQTAQDDGLLVVNNNHALDRAVCGCWCPALSVNNVFKLLFHLETNLISLIDLRCNAQLQRDVNSLNRVEESAAKRTT